MTTMTSSREKTDTELKTDVLNELRYDPSVKVTDIGVLVKDGTVTLNGFVSGYSEKWEAIRALKRVAGVKAIADDIEVKLPDSLRLTDGDIASAAAHRISWSGIGSKDAIKVLVSEGWVTLEGHLEWWYQKTLVENLITYLQGVKGVTNLILIKPTISSAALETSITSAFERNAVLDSKKVHVTTIKDKVILRGEVRNYSELEEAERVAWAAPGVLEVDNQLTVQSAWCE